MSVASAVKSRAELAKQKHELKTQLIKAKGALARTRGDLRQHEKDKYSYYSTTDWLNENRELKARRREEKDEVDRLDAELKKLKG